MLSSLQDNTKIDAKQIKQKKGCTLTYEHKCVSVNSGFSCTIGLHAPCMNSFVVCCSGASLLCNVVVAFRCVAI